MDARFGTLLFKGQASNRGIDSRKNPVEIKEMERIRREASEYVGDAATAMYFMMFLQVIHPISDPSLVRTSRSLSGREDDLPFLCAITFGMFLFRTCGYCYRQQQR